MADGGHSFGKKTFHKPTYCHHCSDLLWGLIGQGYICEVCNFIVHERCVTNVVTPCSGIAPSIIKNPVAHCWSEPTHHKRRFCTVCRKRLDETPAVHCMICEYFAHVECQDFAVADCKENATYVPGKDLASVKHQHHWREGNLPQTSKCYHCKKSCFSSECLTGYRCEWCGATCHGGCRSLVNPECKFGVLEPIYLPPHAVSIPRTEVPMEAIIGVQVKSRSTPLQRDYSCPELRTIGLCDATDSELSIRHLDMNAKEALKQMHLLPSPSMGDPKNRSWPKIASRRRAAADGDRLEARDILDIDDCAEAHSDYSSCNLDVGVRKDKRAHSAENVKSGKMGGGGGRARWQVERLKASEMVTRSRSFQEQGVQPPFLKNSRFFVNRLGHSSSNLGAMEDSLSHSMDLTQHPMKMSQSVDIRIEIGDYCEGKGHPTTTTTTYLPYQQGHNTTTVKSGHILGRIFRRMRKISLAWRKSRCKIHRARSISEEFSSGDAARFRDEEYTSKPEGACASGSHPRAESAHKSDKDKERRDKEKEDKDEETIKVFDGNSSLRRRIFRAITVSRTCTLDQLLTTALRAFHIARNPSEFFLTDLYAQGGEEVRVQDPHPVLTLTRIEGKRPAIFLRFRDNENDKGFVRVYPGKLQLDDIEESFVAVPVDNDTTVRDLIRDALNLFALEGRNVDEYRCLEVLLDRGVTERILCNNERPWEIMKQLGRDSIRQMELMRFYLQHKQDPHGPNLALFVGNLPPGLSQRNYEHMLNKYVSEDKFTSIGPIYYEYGSVVITYEDASKAVRAFYTLREAICEGKNLLVLLLPNIEPSMVRPETFPLLVFVNVKSGGCQGLELISSFRKLLNPYQVFDLDNGGPLPGLYVFRHIKTYKILVCGGDGTIGWVLQCLDNVGQDSECSSPPCAIVPLGTGNDLARVLRWGPGYTGGEDPLNLLRDVIEAEEIRLDRWTVVFHPEDKPEDVAPKAPSNSTGKKKKKVRTAQPSQQNQQLHLAAIANQGGGAQSEDNSQIFVMNNYFGIGIDADLCLDFHNAREENPNKFNSRLHNKGVYVKMGLRKMVGRKIVKELHKEIRLEVDGKVVELPQVEGIIILNILSWGSGANPWGPEKEDQFSKPNHWDGMLEIVGVTGVVHLGQIQSGLRSAIRIAQGGHIKIHMYSEIPVQVDGEPWVQSPGDVVVLKSALKATMLKKSKTKRRLTEPIIQPAVAGSTSQGGPQPENGDRDKEPLGT
ncbi:diacylglycerol kinase theta isoform X2 [Lutzomyia longipalpis]|uniref:diacylglycerol kinase theta isoform X2 n=1 Tax=Lutzomyia longipalpis TaxID=7200 RepID=UPI0024835E00|nr:diacylglycerol kinase theta isoform X2 [Lutzomyia longipalpis]